MDVKREADVGGILGQTVDLVGSAGRAVVAYTLVLGLFSGLGGLFGLVSLNDDYFSLQWGDGEFATETLGALSGLFELANLVLFLVASYFLLRALLASTGRRPAAGSRFWQFLAMSILAAIGVTIGFVFLVIPGIIVLVRWSAANGYVLTGEHGISGSLGASWEATDGHALSIFGAGVVLWIGLFVLGAVVVGTMAGAGYAVGDAIFSPMAGLVVALAGLIESFNNAMSFAFSIAVFHLVAATDTSVADVFE